MVARRQLGLQISLPGPFGALASPSAIDLDETYQLDKPEIMEIAQPLSDLVVVLAFFAAALAPKAVSFYLADREHK